MTWECRFAREAERGFRRLPRDRRQQVARAIDEMTEDPSRGDVQPIKSGKFQGALRKRVGRYRIIFSLDPDQGFIDIAAILTRTEATCR